MKIFNNVKIGYKDYQVNLVDHDIFVDGEECFGQINYIDQVIRVGNKFKDGQKKATFVHEVVHGIDEMYGTELTEKQVEMFSKGLYLFVLDNPDVFRVEWLEEIYVCKIWL